MYPKVVYQNQKKNAVGFPSPILGEKPLRLPVLAETKDWIALDKPVGFGTRAHPWDNVPNIDEALNIQLDAGKPELIARGATLFGSIYYLDPAASGISIFAKNREALANLRNRFGSGECSFRFIFISASQSIAKEPYLESSAPLLPHNMKPKMIPSTAKGKKALTKFHRIAESSKGWVLWEARVTFFRPHQVRTHAAVLGIPILGDALYNGPEAPSQRELNPKKQRPALNLPSYQGLALHLTEMQLNTDCPRNTIISKPHKHLRLLMRRMELAG